MNTTKTPAATKKRLKYQQPKESSNIGCILSLNPLDDLTLGELEEFLIWQRHYSGLTADEYGKLPQNEQLSIFLEWCAAIALEGARIGVRILCRRALEIEKSEKI